MLDEIVFRWHQILFWWDMHRENWWGYQYLVAYPFWCGLLIGVLTGYYAEPFMDFCEKHAGRRAIRRKIKRNIAARKRNENSNRSGRSEGIETDQTGIG
jgi:hypothetical protein